MLRPRTVAIFGLAILSNIFGQEANVRIFGRVIDANGSGVPNTKVVFTSSDTKRTAGKTHTDTEGRFRSPSLAPQSYQVSFPASGYYVATRQVTGTLGGNVDIGDVRAWTDASNEPFDPVANQSTTKPIELPEYCALDMLQFQSACLVTVDGDGNGPREPPRGNELAFWLQPDGKRRYLKPMNGARLAIAHPSLAGEIDCHPIQYLKGKVRIDGTVPVTNVCLGTKDGRYFQFAVTSGKKAVSLLYFVSLTGKSPE